MKKLFVSPITRFMCNRILREEAQKSALYQMARKVDDKDVEYGGIFGLPPRCGKPWLFADWWVREAAHKLADQVRRSIDALVVLETARNTETMEGENFYFFKKCLTVQDVKAAVDSLTAQPFTDSDGEYYVCATSTGRLKHILDCRDFEPEHEYHDYFNRQLWGGEAGRLKLSAKKYVVFLDVCSDEGKTALMFGADSLVCSSVENNLVATFKKTGADDNGFNAALVVGWEMHFTARPEQKDGVVVLEATRNVKG